MSLTVGDAALHAAGGDRPSDRGGAERKRAREAAARTMGFASYAAYHLQRWHHAGRRTSDMADECGVSQSAIREGERELLGITTVPLLGSRRPRPRVRQRPDRRKTAGSD
jgi:hypothetical protein